MCRCQVRLRSQQHRCCTPASLQPKSWPGSSAVVVPVCPAILRLYHVLYHGFITCDAVAAPCCPAWLQLCCRCWEPSMITTLSPLWEWTFQPLGTMLNDIITADW
jgi:hypothetical protein